MNEALRSRRVSDLFEALADLDPAEAERRLASECAADVTLADAVRELLTHDRAAAGDFLSPIAARALQEISIRLPGVADPLTTAEGPLPPPARLGRYAVQQKVGEGGMGSVHVGYDEGLDRRVALKVLHDRTATRDWLLREGQALGRLSHPNVVAIHEVGEEAGRVFLAMELVEGPTLRTWLDAAPRSFTDILRLFLQAGRGLAAAHRAGLVHRDFKPENVLIGPDGRARVGDFGIAALAARPRAETAGSTAVNSSPSLLGTALTQRGALVGTPAFMSPEQFEGERATPWSDQWSFAVALYRATYGVSPWQLGDLAALAHSVRSAPPATPPRRADVPIWLWPLLLKALQRSPDQRFQSMDQLLLAIEKHVPRDPDQDPTIVARERAILSAVACIGYVAQACFLVYPPAARVFLQPVWFTALPAAELTVLVPVVLWRWRRIARNAYGRRVAVMFVTAFGVTLFDRLIGLCLGLTGPQLLVEDAAMVTVWWAALAQTEHRWLWWLSALSALVAVGAAFQIEHAATIVGTAALLSIGAFCLRLFVDRNMSPNAAMGEVDRDEDRVPLGTERTIEGAQNGG